MITPLPIIGRVNINTASQRLLSALPGVSKELAKNIFDGIDSNNKPSLKPYLNLSDLLKVKGITPEAFERCCNILTVDSSVFTVEVEAQTLKPSMRKDGTKSSAEAVGSTRKKRYVVEVERNENGICSIGKLEAYTP
jgi:type II secretory pathway component PulK